MTQVPKFTPHPQSAPGDFYVQNGECLACGFPHVIAPDLIGWADAKAPHCGWEKEPVTPGELERACGAGRSRFNVSSILGSDRALLSRVQSTYCDYPVEATCASRA